MDHEIIRPLTPAFLDAFIDLKRDFFAIDGYPFDEALTRSNARYISEHPELGAVFMICDETGTPIGFLVLAFLFSFEFGGRVAFLDELCLGDKARGKGYGKYAVNFVKAYAAGNNLKAVFLEVEQHNERARGLYTASGFKDHHRRLMIYRPE
ncbi:GNAT family N-acetyltransferase [Niabella sp. CC-SYL272]|uniref:GNAT family N-acetyltransferase n=1 Tax=Niabella agricola TaxID=2891571 RepID=UPI001F372B07|nr:GNAT family N-acetyltransferase [Niabella agricola]MCF3108031.1 GNAT family N-acetyltransferase [Niabella agricola]